MCVCECACECMCFNRIFISALNRNDDNYSRIGDCVSLTAIVNL